MKRSFVFFCLLFFFGVFSCKKSEVIPLSSFSRDSVLDQNSRLKASSSGACFAPGTYRIDTKYKLSYLHLKQYDGYSCSWTSYVIAVGCISNASYPCPVDRYPVSVAQVKTVKAGCNDSKYMYSLCSYGQGFDTRFASFQYVACSSSDRSLCLSRMLSHLSTVQAPFLVISTRGVGHYRIVFSIVWTGAESSSTVYYMDCADADKGSFDANIQNMSLSLFLDKMIQSTNCYNMLFISPK